MNSLLRITVGEEAESEDFGKLYEWIGHLIWKKGFPGLTIRRSELSLDNEARKHISILEDESFNDKSVIIETINQSEAILRLADEMKRHIPHGQISVIPGMQKSDLESHRYFMVKVYTKEENTWFKRNEYDKVLDFFQERNAIWTSITKGFIGYGKDRVIHRQKIFSFSQQMPLVIEGVVCGKNLKPLLSGLKDVVEEGAVFTTPIHLIMNL